jgi:hypothetical protein
VVVMVAVGSASMMHFHLLCYESESESGSDFFSIILATSDYLK